MKAGLDFESVEGLEDKYLFKSSEAVIRRGSHLLIGDIKRRVG